MVVIERDWEMQEEDDGLMDKSHKNSKKKSKKGVGFCVC